MSTCNITLAFCFDTRILRKSFSQFSIHEIAIQNLPKNCFRLFHLYNCDLRIFISLNLKKTAMNKYKKSLLFDLLIRKIFYFVIYDTYVLEINSSYFYGSIIILSSVFRFQDMNKESIICFNNFL